MMQYNCCSKEVTAMLYEWPCSGSVCFCLPLESRFFRAALVFQNSFSLAIGTLLFEFKRVWLSNFHYKLVLLFLEATHFCDSAFSRVRFRPTLQVLHRVTPYDSFPPFQVLLQASHQPQGLLLVVQHSLQGHFKFTTAHRSRAPCRTLERWSRPRSESPKRRRTSWGRGRSPSIEQTTSSTFHLCLPYGCR